MKAIRRGRSAAVPYHSALCDSQGLRRRGRAGSGSGAAGRLLLASMVALLMLALAAPAAGAGPIPAGEPAGPIRGALPLLAVQRAHLIAADGAAGDLFGNAFALSGDTLVVGAYGDDVGANSDQGSAYVYLRTGATWELQQQLVAPDGAAGDEFGNWVALSGDTALIAAFRDDVAYMEQGSVYVFTRSGSTWSYRAKLLDPEPEVGENFGASLSLSGDTALISAPLDDVTVTEQGSACVFVGSGDTWTFEAKLAADDGAFWDYFGIRTALSGDTAVIGAQGDDIGACEDQGSAYVFVRSGATWSLQQKLIADDGQPGDNLGAFGVAVAGDTAVVGACYDDVGGQTDQGSAYVFVRSGTTWSQQQKLIADDGAAGDTFGDTAALSGDTLLLGAWGDDVGANADQGSAYLFGRSGGIWSQQQKLLAADGAADDRFGRGVAMEGDTALVGAIYDDVGASADQGSAYLFEVTTDGDVTAPVTTATLAPLPNAAGWSRSAVTVTLSAADAESGLDKTFYRLGDVGGYTQYDPAAKPVVSANGIRKVWFYSTDRAGHTEAARSLTVRVDKTRPVTKALADASVARYSKATLRLRVNDTVSPKARVTVRIFRHGVLKKTLKLGLRKTNTEVHSTFTCSLARGSYIWKVYATDLAGNPARTPVGYRRLTVW